RGVVGTKTYALSMLAGPDGGWAGVVWAGGGPTGGVLRSGGLASMITGNFCPEGVKLNLAPPAATRTTAPVELFGFGGVETAARVTPRACCLDRALNSAMALVITGAHCPAVRVGLR